MGRLLELWCRGTTPSNVREWLTPHLRRSGFEGRLLADAASGSREKLIGWDWLHLGGEDLFAAISSRTEDCTVFSLCTHVHSPSGRLAFRMLWDSLLRDPPPWLAESILQKGTMDVFPLLAHSFSRLQPLTVVNLDERTPRPRRPRDQRYWEEVGPRLHFLAATLLAGPRVPAPDALAASLGARLERVPGGIVLDCGWSRHGTVRDC